MNLNTTVSVQLTDKGVELYVDYVNNTVKMMSEKYEMEPLEEEAMRNSMILFLKDKILTVKLGDLLKISDFFRVHMADFSFKAVFENSIIEVKE